MLPPICYESITVPYIAGLLRLAPGLAAWMHRHLCGDFTVGQCTVPHMQSTWFVIVALVAIGVQLCLVFLAPALADRENERDGRMASGAPAITESTRSMRVVTYNVHKCRGLDGRVRPLRILEVLRETRASVAGLQEILASQAQLLADELEMQFVLGENRKFRGEPYGNVVLSRFPIRRMRNYDLSLHGYEERGCLRADLDLGGERQLHVFNVHLGTAVPERRHQGRRLVTEELINDVSISEPRIVLGDFNEWTTGLATRLLSLHLASADIRLHLRRSRTYPGLLPFLHLDHIYYDPALRLEQLVLHRSPRALMASDHLPLVADFGIEDLPPALPPG
jgi:endonuclease/exonuclease/phosphatase family metal-dependent hydrolase